MMSRYLLAPLICFSLLAPAAAHADLKYFPDPAYKRLNDDDPPPMSEMVDLAKDGDARAMFILGDMSEKGKGGLPQDRKLAYRWFEESAMHDYPQSFIRLAAMAKHDKNPKDAWKWYTLAIDGFDAGAAKDYCVQARKDLEASAKLTQDDLDQAHAAVNEWKNDRDKHLHEEEEADAKKEQDKKDQADKDAQVAKDKADKEQAAKDKADENDADDDADDAPAVKTAKASAEKADKEKTEKTDKQENDDDDQN